MAIKKLKPSISNASLLKRATLTLRMEGDAIHRLADQLDQKFVDIVTLILNSTGRVVLTGVGKSADVGRKIVATLNSTGSPAVFVHAGDAVHGDLGQIQKGDVVLCLSKSGRSQEILALTPSLKALGHPVVGITGSIDSPLAQQSDYVLVAGVDPEACPFDLAPTTSTAVQMALGDALALCLMEARGFSATDFAKFHPGGNLGKRLTVRLVDLIDSDRMPSVTPESSLQEILISMTTGRYGATAVVKCGKDSVSTIVGIITDGDLRRALEAGNTSSSTATDIMNNSPLSINGSSLAANAAVTIQKRGISQVIVTNEDGSYTGMVHLHDLVKEGMTQIS